MESTLAGVGEQGPLRTELERALSCHLGTQRRIARLECRPFPYHSTFALHELDVELEDGQRLELLWKDLSPGAVIQSAKGVKPAFLQNPLREIEAYERLLAPRRLGATFYGAVVDAASDCYWLFLEKVAGVPLWEVGESAAWQEAARWLAAFHACWAGGTPPPRTDHFLQYDHAFYGRWLDRAAAFARRQPRATRAGSEAMVRVYERSVDRLVHMTPSIIHGDFYASNILIQRSLPLRVCPVDWEVTGIGPPLIDLASLIAGRWTEQRKRTLAQSYHAALPIDRAMAQDYETFIRDLDCCRLHVALQWLSWSADWIPPEDHAQDWLGEAISLAERIDG